MLSNVTILYASMDQKKDIAKGLYGSQNSNIPTFLLAALA